MAISAQTMDWVKSLSPSLAKTYLNTTNNDRKKIYESGSGFLEGQISASNAAFVLFDMIILVSSVLYLIYRVYYRAKPFSKDYVQKHQESTLIARELLPVKFIRNFDNDGNKTWFDDEAKIQ